MSNLDDGCKGLCMQLCHFGFAHEMRSSSIQSYQLGTFKGLNRGPCYLFGNLSPKGSLFWPRYLENLHLVIHLQ